MAGCRLHQAQTDCGDLFFVINHVLQYANKLRAQRTDTITLHIVLHLGAGSFTPCKFRFSGPTIDEARRN